MGIARFAIGGSRCGGGGSEPPAPPKKEKPKATAQTTDPKESEAGTVASEDPGVINEGAIVAAAALPARDPFDGSMYQPKPQEIKPTPPPTTAPQPRGPRGSITGKLPPFDPGMGSLPNPTGNGGITLEPGKPMVDPTAFGYGVSGVITGAQPAAVFTDANGAQRLISEGGAIDGDSRVISISRGKVVVRHKNKTLTLTVGGSTNEK